MTYKASHSLSVLLLACAIGVSVGPRALGGSVFSFEAVQVNAWTYDIYLKEVATGSASVIYSENGLEFGGVRVHSTSNLASPVGISGAFVPDPENSFDGETFIQDGPSDATLNTATFDNPPVFGTVGPNGGEIRLGRFTFSGGVVGEDTSFVATIAGPQNLTFSAPYVSETNTFLSIEDRFPISSASFDVQGGQAPAATPLPPVAWGGIALLGSVALGRLKARMRGRAKGAGTAAISADPASQP